MQTLFPLPEPRKDLLNPLLLVYGQAAPGTKCKGCRHLMRFQQSTSWMKCALNRGGKSPDHKALWQACSRFQSEDPSCTGCGAKRLDDCIC